ncbi:asparaginase [Pseudonocardia sp. K10HN5]|uniref:Asparaginase n=1 Tax=Pseudonocardia acidicola TaxID=2724939 RepID=A0ABX1SGB3_9PSEU|nr:asparaginase [Pseudonocardia acidicola]
MDETAVPIAHVVRGGVVESVHHGLVVGLDPAGSVAVRQGDPATVIFPRSALKPVQAVAMLRVGLDLDGELLALASSSHSGEEAHREGARRLLAGAGLAEHHLQNTLGLPRDAAAALAWQGAGHPPAPLAQNCSGKHAAMLATCVAAGWDTATYRDPTHPLQRAIRATVAELTGDDVTHVTVDGCGAPLFSCTLGGLARAFARIATADPRTPAGRVAAALRSHPWWLGGTGRPVTRFIEGVPGLIGKDGAEGVFAAALADGRAAAVKVLDGAARPVPAVVAATLRALGVDAPALDEIGRVDVLGHGRPVGAVVALDYCSSA